MKNKELNKKILSNIKKIFLFRTIFMPENISVNGINKAMSPKV